MCFWSVFNDSLFTFVNKALIVVRRMYIKMIKLWILQLSTVQSFRHLDTGQNFYVGYLRLNFHVTLLNFYVPLLGIFTYPLTNSLNSAWPKNFTFAEKKFDLVLDNVLGIAQIVFVALSNAKQTTKGNSYGNNRIQRIHNRNVGRWLRRKST